MKPDKSYIPCVEQTKSRKSILKSILKYNEFNKGIIQK